MKRGLEDNPRGSLRLAAASASTYPDLSTPHPTNLAFPSPLLRQNSSTNGTTPSGTHGVWYPISIILVLLFPSYGNQGE